MFYDQHDNQLKVGDRILIPAVVTEINENASPHCCMQVETVHRINPAAPATQFSLNPRQAVLDRTEIPNPAPAPDTVGSESGASGELAAAAGQNTAGGVAAAALGAAAPPPAATVDPATQPAT